MPLWQSILLMAALVAAMFVVFAGIRLWRDPYALIRTEYARQRWLCGLRRRVLKVDGRRWVYAEGEASDPAAPTIVMLHGFTGSKENWYLVAKRLRGRYRLLIPDLPGWGESERRDDGDDGFSAQAKRVVAFVRATCTGPVMLLGHSMGGGIAAVVAARDPQRVSHVGLLNAAGVRFAENQFGLDVLAGRNPFGVHDSASLDSYFDVLFHDRSALPPLPKIARSIFIAQRVRDADFEQSILGHIGRGMEQFLPGEVAREIRQPTLLLWGAHDKVIDPSAMQIYAQRIPQARQVLLRRSGHMTIMEQPDEVAAAVIALAGTMIQPSRQDHMAQASTTSGHTA